MFPSPVTGEMYYPDSIVNLHKKILKDAGLPHIRFHDLRHTFATLALQNGVDVKTVSSMLGHYDAGFTLRTYTHATRQKQDEAAQTMGNFMAQVAVAFLIAVPVAWYALDRWLQDYSVRIRLGAWIFLAAGAFAAIVALATVFWQSSRAAAANPVDALKN